jgi:hypothetical protein
VLLFAHRLLCGTWAVRRKASRVLLVACMHILCRPFLLKLLMQPETKIINKERTSLSYSNHILVTFLTWLPLLISWSIVIGFAIVSYIVSYLIFRLVSRRRIFWRLLSWSILLPLCLGLAASFIWLINARSEPLARLPNPLTLFLRSVSALVKVHSLTAFWVIIWLLGILFIIRKHDYFEQ